MRGNYAASMLMHREAPPLWILEPGPDELGGGWLFALRFARSVSREVTIVCPAGSPVDAAASGAGIPVLNVSFPAPAPSRTPEMLACARSLRRAIPQDVVVVSGAIRASLAAGIARLSNPLVHLMHEQDSAARLSVQVALRRSRAVVAVGGQAAEAYRRALPRAVVVAVNNFLAPQELESFMAARAVRARATRSTAPVLAVVARLIPEKGIDVLIDELTSIPDLWSRLLVAGNHQDAAYVRGIQERVLRDRLGARVHLLGPRSDIPSLLADVDALVVPSTGNEGQPTVILEALAAGLPVIARSALVGPEFGDLPVVSFDDASGLGSALRHLPVAAADPEILAQRFSVDQVIDQLDRAALRASMARRRR